MQKIVLITSGQPSLNPRLIKEADVLASVGYDVMVIYQYWNDWGTEMDATILPKKKWKSRRVGGNPHTERFGYLKTKIRNKLAIKLTIFFGFKLRLAEFSLNRSYSEMVKAACEIPDAIYLAHNLGALPVAIAAAKKKNGKSGFDAEDFHRYEVADDPLNFDVRLKTYIENTYLIELDYFSTASPLITNAYQLLYPNLTPITLLNVFQRQIIRKKLNVPGNLKLFWFSQTIGKNRGLEMVIQAINDLPQFSIEVHLLGYYDKNTNTKFNEMLTHEKSGSLFFYPPMKPDDIFKFAAQFDIGLATEISFPINRDLCLTNKIFTYIQSGLAVVATDTSAQKHLLNSYPEIGRIFKKSNVNELTAILENYCINRNLLAKHQQSAKKLAENELNWETESEKFIHHIKNLQLK